MTGRTPVQPVPLAAERSLSGPRVIPAGLLSRWWLAVLCGLTSELFPYVRGPEQLVVADGRPVGRTAACDMWAGHVRGVLDAAHGR